MARQKKDYPERPCDNPTCGVVFKPTRPWQRFHIPECKQAYHRGMAKCLECGAVFHRARE